MDKFKNIDISDREWVNKILKDSYCPSLEYNFTTLFIWSDIYYTQVRECEGCLLVRYGKERKSYLFPIGKNVEKALLWLVQNCDDLQLVGLVRENKELLESLYPDKFEYCEDRNMSDYIYKTESLMTLSGKKLSSKRNHINRFVENHADWSYEPISGGNFEIVYKMHDEWMEINNCSDKHGLTEEGCAVKKALKYFNELELSGGLLKIGKKAIAFSIGDELNKDTFIVHIEKAYADIQGAYPMINKQFVIHNCENYEFVDREEDTGDEGLRKAKLSYNPYIILEKYRARKIK